jgi:hypothetical protein
MSSFNPTGLVVAMGVAAIGVVSLAMGADDIAQVALGALIGVLAPTPVIYPSLTKEKENASG